MKKNLLLIIPIVLISLNSCKKSDGVYVIPNTLDTSVSTDKAGTPVPASGVDTSKGYFPSLANTFWKYRSVSGTSVDTAIDELTGNTTIINGKLYYEAKNIASLTGTTTGYYSATNHTYSQRGTSNYYGLTVDLLYLKDNLAVNSTWTAPFTDNGTLKGFPAQIVGKITEKDITKTVSNKIYSNVIHTNLLLQYNLGSGFATYGTYDYYIAKGVGIIEGDAVVNYPGRGTINATTILIDYAIK
jgi:hypothetical protein